SALLNSKPMSSPESVRLTEIAFIAGGGGGGAEKAVTDIDEIKTLKIVLLWTDCFIKRSHFGK
ncbi:hypothetical protein O8G41_002024, partial [Neisseria gonorrhoeae]